MTAAIISLFDESEFTTNQYNIGKDYYIIMNAKFKYILVGRNTNVLCDANAKTNTTGEEEYVFIVTFILYQNRYH